MAKDTIIHIRVDQATKDKLNEICKAEHRSQSEQISYMIENWNNDKEKK